MPPHNAKPPPQGLASRGHEDAQDGHARAIGVGHLENAGQQRITRAITSYHISRYDTALGLATRLPRPVKMSTSSRRVRRLRPCCARRAMPGRPPFSNPLLDLSPPVAAPLAPILRLHDASGTAIVCEWADGLSGVGVGQNSGSSGRRGSGSCFGGSLAGCPFALAGLLGDRAPLTGLRSSRANSTTRNREP